MTLDVKLAILVQPTLKVVCCVCAKDLQAKPCLPSQVGQISHGYCAACAAVAMAEARVAASEARLSGSDRARVLPRCG